MGKILLMDENLSNKIAAGEVVEKIANVVKETVENSIDASSKNINIDLIASGTKSIKVTDDGCGMDKEDAVKAFYSHATSKIKNENDLYFINTLGFRGEALASIASVSDIDLYTRVQNESTGTHIFLKAGQITLNEIGNANSGTSIEIHNLFYNTPVRLKFLKSLNTELSNIVLYLEKLSLSHPDISFSLTNDEKLIFKTSGSGQIDKAIFEVYGYNVSKNICYVEGENDDYLIKGYITNINIQKSNKNGLITIVNGRVVQNAFLNKTIKDAYHTYMFESKYPIVVLYIETDPTLIDVNIHPTKQDIKFSKIDTLSELVFNMIRGKLLEINNTFKAYIMENENETYDDNNSNNATNFSYVQSEKDYNQNRNNYIISSVSNNKNEEISSRKNMENIEFNFNVMEKNSTYNDNEENLISVVGLALGTYLIAQENDLMYLIDIHAANERINYEKYLKALKEAKTETISLLIPISLEYTKNEFLILMEEFYLLTSLGFKVEEFGNNTLRVLSHPTWLKKGFEEDSIRTIFDLIINYKEKFDRVAFNDHVAATLACKASIKANSILSLMEQEVLIERLFKCENPYTCPHGRPTIIKYPKYELEKMFKRAE